MAGATSAERMPKGGGAISEQEAYERLCGYTLMRGRTEFIHQLVVDAFAVQRADERTPPIRLTFALVGLYLAVEKHFTGRQVQRVHMLLARRRQDWPTFILPRERGAMTVLDVLSANEGPERDGAIRAWCASVWAAFADSRATVVELLKQRGIA
jgi:hypothetical protein